MIALFLLLVIVAIVLGIIGVVAKGLLYLLIIGCPMHTRPGQSGQRLIWPAWGSRLARPPRERLRSTWVPPRSRPRRQSR